MTRSWRAHNRVNTLLRLAYECSPSVRPSVRRYRCCFFFHSAKRSCFCTLDGWTMASFYGRTPASANDLTAATVRLRFAWVVDDAKCIVVTRVCVTVPRRIPTLLHGPWCNFEEWYGVPPAIGRICNRCTGFVAMTTQHEREMSASALYSLYAWFRLVIWHGGILECAVQNVTGQIKAFSDWKAVRHKDKFEASRNAARGLFAMSPYVCNLANTARFYVFNFFYFYVFFILKTLEKWMHIL